MTQSAPETATAVFIGLLAAGLAAMIVLERARPMPPANPPIVILAQDAQAVAAIAAARAFSANVNVILSARCASRQAGEYLRALALSGEAFAAWKKSAPPAASGPPEHWHEIFRLAGKVLPAKGDPQGTGLRAACREARVIVLCRGGWSGPVQAILAENEKRLLLAPGVDNPAGSPITPDAWDDPARLARSIEDVLLGVRRKEKRT